MFDFLRGKKEDKNRDIKGSLMYGVLAGESSKPLSEQERIADMQINPYLFRSFRIEGMLENLFRQSVQEGQPDLDLLALATLMDGVIRVSNIDQTDVHIGYLKTRRILRRIEMNSPHMEGIINLIEACDLERMTAWSDAKGGWKAKLMKVTPKSFEVTMREGKEKKGGIP